MKSLVNIDISTQYAHDANPDVLQPHLDKYFRSSMKALRVAWAERADNPMVSRDSIVICTGDIQQMIDDPEEYLLNQQHLLRSERSSK